MVGISVDTPFKLKASAGKLGVSYPMLSDFNKEAIKAFGIVLPELKCLREVAGRGLCWTVPVWWLELGGGEAWPGATL